MLAFDALLYWLLAWYFDSVLAGSFGSSKPWYFPLTDTYEYFLVMCGLKPEYDASALTSTMQILADESLENDSNMEPVNPILQQKGVAVRVRNLVKIFKVAGEEKRAVDDLSLDIYKSEIFALLG